MSERHISQALHGNGRSVKPFFVCWCLYTLVLLSSATALRELCAAFDFRAFYAAGYMVRTEPTKLYDFAEQQRVQNMLVSRSPLAIPFIHPSYEALLFAPFSLLSYPCAYLCFIAFNLVLLGVFFLAAYALFSSPIPIWQPRPGLMLFAFLPVYIAILHGQDSILFLLLCYVVCRQLERGASAWAGCALALALFKFQWAIPIAILWSFRRGWRFITGFLVTAVGVAGVCLIIGGRTGLTSLMKLVGAASLAPDQELRPSVSVPLHSPRGTPNLSGLLYPITHRLSPETAVAATVLVSAGVFGWCWCMVRKCDNDRVAFAISLVCAALVSYHMNLYDETALLLAMALLAGELSKAAWMGVYAAPALLLGVFGSDWLFLAAIPTIWLLAEASQHVRSSLLTSAEATA